MNVAQARGIFAVWEIEIPLPKIIQLRAMTRYPQQGVL